IWIMVGETFPTRNVVTASNSVWNFLIAFFTPFIVDSISYRYHFVFSACNLVGAVIVYLFLHESSDLSLENMYGDPSCKPWTSHNWTSPDFSSRKDLIEQMPAAELRKPLAEAHDERIT
ncbi:uncharacterized protein LAESUDRAFT_667621, partial [Laetiporus sulphureus 93-53]